MMRVETKYDAGQKVYFFAKGKIQCDKIYQIKISVTDDRYVTLEGNVEGHINIDLKYDIMKYGDFYESDLFATREELINAVK
ncbi:hypothetical protein ACI760_01420 [Capnocytophaga canimorsus]|uniref:hypothetical protein n=1 Tax=Capnocytophaga canimorsus TaxID=28188 RepID=UPI00385FD0A3